jgi:uncharacterized protein (TIGR02646 family)
MQRIVKTEPNFSFSNFVHRNNPQNWDQLPVDIKNESKEYILNTEQNGLSGYTEKPLKSDTHIDHYIKKDLNPKLTFDWNNLIIDEKNDHYGARFKDTHIHYLNQYTTILNPVTDDVQLLFYYSQTGRIDPHQDLTDLERVKAKNTIDIFNLNHPDLVNKRKGLLKNIQDFQNQIENEIIFEYLSKLGFHSLIKQELFLSENRY